MSESAVFSNCWIQGELKRRDHFHSSRGKNHCWFPLSIVPLHRACKAAESVSAWPQSASKQIKQEKSSRHWVCLAYEKFRRLDWLAAAFEPTVRNYHILSGRPLMVRELTPFPKHIDRRSNQILSTSSGKAPVEWWMLTSSRRGWEGRGSSFQLELQPGRTENAGWWDFHYKKPTISIVVFSWATYRAFLSLKPLLSNKSLHYPTCTQAMEHLDHDKLETHLYNLSSRTSNPLKCTECCEFSFFYFTSCICIC